MAGIQDSGFRIVKPNTPNRSRGDETSDIVNEDAFETNTGEAAEIMLFNKTSCDTLKTCLKREFVGNQFKHFDYIKF